LIGQPLEVVEAGATDDAEHAWMRHEAADYIRAAGALRGEP